MEERGFVEKVKVFSHKGSVHKGLHIDLAYKDGLPVISDLKRVSRPGRRMYLHANELRLVKGGYGLAIVSTSRGVMSSEEAKKKKLGGEVICKVW